MSIPTQQKALFLQAKHGDFVVGTRPVPKPGPGELLVKNEASGLNPVDWKIQAIGIFIEKYPAILGEEAAGVVVAVGDGVAKWKVGDKVVYAGAFEDDRAAFQEYTLIHSDLVAQLPDSLTFDQGAALPIAIDTAAIALYHETGGPQFTAPWLEGGKNKYAGKPIVIAGGASVVGSSAIQFARLSGFSPIITTASLKNTELLKSFGATHVLDRNLSADALRAEVLKIAGGPVSVVFDTISVPETQQAVWELLAPDGKLVTVLQAALTEDQKKNAGKRTIVQARGIVNIPPNVEFGKALNTKLPGLLESGQLKPLRAEVLPGGLGGITAGLDRLKKNQVSGTKLVVHPAETA
ncbi:GroES-like protein [Trametes elegans]|nr:GroES-like protein [Trametes elegans]